VSTAFHFEAPAVLFGKAHGLGRTYGSRGRSHRATNTGEMKVTGTEPPSYQYWRDEGQGNGVTEYEYWREEEPKCS
jgi:hypothetical protein